MHESWGDDEGGFRKLAWASLKKDADHMLSDCTEQMLNEDMDVSFRLTQEFVSLFERVSRHDNPSEILGEVHPDMLKSMSIWAVVGIRSVFARAVEVAIMNDEMGESNDSSADGADVL